MSYRDDQALKDLQNDFKFEGQSLLDEKQICIYQMKFLLENKADLSVIQALAA